jgi:hypothetical protein
MSSEENDLSNLFQAMFLNADGNEQPVLRRLKNQIADPPLSRVETMASLAGVKDETHEVPEAIEDYLLNLTCEAVVFFSWFLAWDARIVSRRRDQPWIDAQPFDFVGELINIALEDWVPTIGLGDCLKDVAQHSEIPNLNTEKRIPLLNENSHSESSEHLARRKDVVRRVLLTALRLFAIQSPGKDKSGVLLNIDFELFAGADRLR